MYSKHLISVVPLLLSIAACSSSGGGEPTGSGGKTDASGGKPAANGGATSGGASSGGTTTGSGGSSSGGNSNGSGGASKGGSSNGGQTGSSGGSSSGGNGMGGGSANSGGKPGSGGAGGASTGSGGNSTGMGGMTGSSGSTGMAAKCDNLSLKPTMTGVAKPSGAAGGLKVLDWAGFKGAVSYTFDDNNPSQVSQYSKLKATGGHVTFFVIGNSVNASQFKPFLADGQEIANHSYTHSNPAPADVASDIKQAQTKIQNDFGVTAISMAAPNCQSAWAAGGKGVVFFNRGACGSDSGIPALSPGDSRNTFDIPAYLPVNGLKDNPSGTQSALVAQHAAGKWRIFVIHGFDTQNGTYQPINADGTAAAMSDGIKNGFWVEGMSNVGAYWQGQKLIPSSATTSATWTLPAQFPKNMCVRITTTGGTVTQKGQEIPWDDHGYYEISLDAGEVTVK